MTDFAVQSYSAEIEHVRRPGSQDRTGVRCRLDVILDPSASRTRDVVVASSIPSAAPAPVTAFYAKQSPSNTPCKIGREDAVAIPSVIPLAWVVVHTSDGA